jgi:phosphate transport system permease protein
MSRYKIALLWGSRAIATVVTILFISILIYLAVEAIAYFDTSLITEELLSAIEGTILIVLLSVLIAAPIAIATAIYIECYGTGWYRDVLDVSFELLATVPSIIIGLFGFSLLLGLHELFPQMRSSLLLASSSIAILILPYMIKSTQIGLAQTPKAEISTIYTLGATKWQSIRYVMLPFARGYMLKGLFLSISRAAEDTAVIMLTGVVASFGSVDSILSPFEALPFYIYYTTANYESTEALHSIYIAIALLMSISWVSMALSEWIFTEKKGR